MAKKFLITALALILLVWIAPVLLAIAAGGLASTLGCELNEGSVHPCVLFGSDIGETLYTFGVVGWLTLIFTPFAVIALVVWVIATVILSCRKAS